MYCFNPQLLAAFASLWRITSAAVNTPLVVPFSSSFSYPQPPTLHAEFTANFMQQKYDTQLRNHITAGFVYYSPSARKIRVDASPGIENTLEVSLFDFSNISAQGNVPNVILSFPEGAIRSKVSCSFFPDGAPPAFQLFAPDLLNSTQAAFIGTEHDALHGPLNAWQFTFPPNNLVTAFVDNNNTLLRFDFSAPGDPLKTFVTTRFFNVVVQPIPSGVFETDCIEGTNRTFIRG